MGLFQGRFARVAVRSVTAAAVSLAVLGAVTSATVGAVMAISQAAGAAVINFADIADGAGFDLSTGGSVAAGAEGSWAFIVGAGVGIKDVGSGISVEGTYSDSAGGDVNNIQDAYFDAGSAGLGACSDINGSAQCNPSDNDNVGAIGGSTNVGGTTFETLTLTFDANVLLTNVVFAGEGHGFFDGNLDINGVIFDLTNTLVTSIDPGLAATTLYAFSYIPILGAGTVNEFYIESVTFSPVPLPAALPLFLSALAGLALLGRRQRKKAAA